MIFNLSGDDGIGDVFVVLLLGVLILFFHGIKRLAGVLRKKQNGNT